MSAEMFENSSPALIDRRDKSSLEKASQGLRQPAEIPAKEGTF